MEYLQEVKHLPTIMREMVQRFHERTPKRLKLIDYFIIFLALMTVLQLVYYTLIGRHPFEAVLSGIYSSLGTLIFTGTV